MLKILDHDSRESAETLDDGAVAMRLYDVYLVVDDQGWYVVVGDDLDDSDALTMAANYQPGDDEVKFFNNEIAARAIYGRV